MPKKGQQLTEEQKEVLRERMAKARAARKAKAQQSTQENKNPEPKTTQPQEPASTELDVSQLTKMVLELQEQLKSSQALTEAFRQGQASAQPQSQQSRISRTLFSEDLSVYESPVPRLLKEPRLQRIAFEHNYDVDYTVVMTKSIEKKDGTLERQPQFNVELQGVVFDDNGEPTNKRFIARKMVFFEDPDTAINIAEKNGLSMDNFPSEIDFLNQMRYLRVRDWVFDFFWPPVNQGNKSDIKDEVIGGQVVRTFQKSTGVDETAGIDYNSLSGSRLR